MNRRLKIFLGVLAVLAPLAVGSLLLAQQISKGLFYVAVRPTNAAQYTLRIDTSQTPQITEIGCEANAISTSTVNCLRFSGSASGSPIRIQGVSTAVGGDLNQVLEISGKGLSNVQIDRPRLGVAGTGFLSFIHGHCSVSAPSALTPAAGAVSGQTPCIAPGVDPFRAAVWVATETQLESWLILQATIAGNGVIGLRYSCASTPACPVTAAQIYHWFAIVHGDPNPD